jgi:hypothetical protein
MAIGRKELKPVDRALADLQAQIKSVERELAAAQAAPAAPRRAAAFKGFLKEVLTPPGKAAAPAGARAKRELPEVVSDPMHDLEADAIPFAQQREPDLFTHAARQPAVAGDSEDRLGKFLAAGSLRPPKPILKGMQRKNRNSFFLWLGLGLATVWLIIVVVR